MDPIPTHFHQFEQCGYFSEFVRIIYQSYIFSKNDFFSGLYKIITIDTNDFIPKKTLVPLSNGRNSNFNRLYWVWMKYKEYLLNEKNDIHI